jgi:hypothetical protein
MPILVLLFVKVVGEVGELRYKLQVKYNKTHKTLEFYSHYLGKRGGVQAAGYFGLSIEELHEIHKRAVAVEAGLSVCPQCFGIVEVLGECGGKTMCQACADK